MSFSSIPHNEEFVVRMGDRGKRGWQIRPRPVFRTTLFRKVHTWCVVKVEYVTQRLKPPRHAKTAKLTIHVIVIRAPLYFELAVHCNKILGGDELRD
jgi:hypothetical protein